MPDPSSWNSGVPPDSSKTSAGNIAEWRELVARCLAGDNIDSAALTKAVRGLRREAPSDLEQLLTAVQTAGSQGPAAVEEAEAWDLLVDYLTASDPAERELPDAARQLVESDLHAAQLVAAFREAGTLREAWLRLSAQVAEESRPWGLVLAGGKWWWANAKRRMLGLLEQGSEQWDRIGNWLRAGTPEPAPTWGNVAPPLSFCLRLPQDLAVVSVEITPSPLRPKQEDHWLLRFSLEPGSRTTALGVALRREPDLIVGPKSLRADRPAEFRIEPPVAERYTVRFDWQSADGSWQEHNEELPLLKQADRA